MTQQPWQPRPGQQPAGPSAWGQPQQPWGQQPAWGQPVVQQRPNQGYYPPQPSYQGQPGGFPPPQPRGGSPVKLLLLGLVAVIAVGFFFVSLMNYLNAGEEAGPGTVPTPDVGQTSAPPTGVPGPDYDPPDIPVPTSWEEAEQWLVDNALYGQSAQVPTNCTLGRIDVESISPQELQEHLEVLTGCLMMVWQEPLERAGFAMPRPPVTVYSQPITTACGEAETLNAFYCSGDQRIYYATDLHTVFYRNNPEVVDNAFLVDNVLGHEFGHAIQGRTGILVSYVAFRNQAKTDADAEEFGRRSELQADCLSGVFLNAVAQASQLTDAERTGLADVSEAIGDDNLTGDPSYVSDHGTGQARRTWFETGLANSAVGVCNSWTAPSSQVR
ncbi:MAG: neutral zinc metallopeptidase [Propionibacteriaceae bacterium]|nr:neutral zinc metallopeptidase [Propionibacteriaceae bacterium]